MKKANLLLSLLLTVLVSLSAQETIELVFTANTQEGSYCPFDAVNVTNVTRGWTETLAYPDTVLVLNSVDGLDEHNWKTFRLGEAFPNPFKDETRILLEMPEADEVYMQVVRIDGCVVASFQKRLDAGLHCVKVGLSSPTMAFLVVTIKQECHVVRILSMGNCSYDAISVESLSVEYNAADQSMRSDATGDFQPGDMMRYTAVLFDGINTIYSNTITQQQYESQTVLLYFDLTLPEVVTAQVTDVTQSEAMGGGEVTATGGVSVTERGICWGTSHNPTIGDSHSNNGTGIGTFTVNMTDLTANTNYYVRAYAINSIGTAYGNEVSFTTSDIPSYSIAVSANPSNGGIVSGGGTYQQGQSCTVTASANSGYEFANWTEGDNVVSSDASYSFTVNGNRALVANFETSVPIGAINGLFTVNANGDQVYFSQGNLQYQAFTNIWRFSENQYEYIGSENSNISIVYSGWIDLFGWGTSGWDCGNTYFHPWDFNDSGSYSLYGPLGQNDLTGDYANSDWGIYNSISNGGDQMGLWRTMTKDEWSYVFSARVTSSGLRYAKAQVNNTNGLILLPDDWDASCFTLSNTNSSAANYTDNIISAIQWSILEEHGAVFLPAAGGRQGINVYDIGNAGHYWSSSCRYNNSAYSVYFSHTDIDQGDLGRPYGLSVRLVKDYNR